MKTRELEYTVDRLREQIARLQDNVEGLVNENKSLQTECKFGAGVALVCGFTIGSAITAAILWA